MMAKTEVPLLLRADTTTNRTRRHHRTHRRRGNPSLVEVGRHLHRRAPVDFRRYCWRCRYSSYAVDTKTKNNYNEKKITDEYCLNINNLKNKKNNVRREKTLKSPATTRTTKLQYYLRWSVVAKRQ